MNEKIKDLIKQVGTDVSGKWMSIDNTEKFAELIVRECIELNRQELAFNAFERMLNKYQKHFGVEE
jgi:hypothetical protein